MGVSREEIIIFMSEKLAVDTLSIDDQTLLFSGGIVDSFALVSLIAFLEEQCGFRVNPMDVNLDNLDSIERMLAFTERIINGL